MLSLASRALRRLRWVLRLALRLGLASVYKGEGPRVKGEGSGVNTSIAPRFEGSGAVLDQRYFYRAPC